MTCKIRPIAERDRPLVEHLLCSHWGSSQIVNSFGSKDCSRLPGFVAADGGQLVGLLTYQIADGSCEVVSLNSLHQGQGVGSQLMRAAEAAAQAAGCRRIWLITTNDNLHALRFYQKRGYELVQVHRRAVEAARRIKPEIPLFGDDGIPLRDEIELEKTL